ncbi:MAG: 23S rRNA (guanine(2445)-N(2))/(guanine(2069)-N(7))-methyltransferase, partial [Nevskiaceae bacterium]
ALTVIQQVLELPSANLHYKLRRAQKGPSQYQRQADTERYHIVQEHGAKLWVNFDDYLDTGLFLDHRPMRLRLQKECAGKRFLNLFCYTGAATVQAAVGGAAQTLSVDLSNTYLDWLAQNLELNQIACTEVDGRGPLPTRLPAHATLRADCLEWLARTAADPRAPQFDVIFCDPPTFSNSKKMEDSWDVQRDHAALIADAMRLLAPGGVLYFSCNRQRFKLDALEGYQVRDISPQTLDEDFKRPPPAHRCWRITA